MSDRAVEAHPAPADADEPAAQPAVTPANADEPPAEPPGRPWAPSRRHTVRLVALGVFAAALLLAFSLAKGLEAGRRTGSPLLGKPAPDFTLPTLDGDGVLDSTELLGNVTVVNFWASWCVPCRTEAPNLESFARRWAPAGVRVIGILYNDSVENGRAFRDEFAISYPLLRDANRDTAIGFGIAGIPETFVIDERGVVIARLIGAVGPTTLDEVLAQVAATGRTVETRNGDYQQAPPSR